MSVCTFVCEEGKAGSFFAIVLGKHTNNLEHVFVKLTVYTLRREKVSAC